MPTAGSARLRGLWRVLRASAGVSQERGGAGCSPCRCFSPLLTLLTLHYAVSVSTFSAQPSQLLTLLTLLTLISIFLYLRKEKRE